MVGGVRLVNLSLVLAVLSGSIVVMQQHVLQHAVLYYAVLCHTTLGYHLRIYLQRFVSGSTSTCDRKLCESHTSAEECK